MDKQPFISVVEQICEEKGIAKEKVLETIEMALAAAYKKDFGQKGQNIKVRFDLETGRMKVFQVKLVVDQSMLREETEERSEEEIEEREEEEEEIEGEKKVRFNPEKHILVEEFKKLPAKGLFNAKGKLLTKEKKKKMKPGEEIAFALKVHQEFGRIAAQTAKQVIVQRIREAEREAVYEEYKDRQGEIVSGIIQRVEGRNVFLDIGKALGILFPEEQIPRENYRMGQRLRAYVLEVQKDSRGPTIILSRAHPKIVSQLFALEVPEIASGTVVIKSIAREAGSRTKIAVTSTEERVDPIGSMIGQKGTRVQAVINELSGEKIDIIEWSEDPAKFISAALSPAKVLDVKIDKKRGQVEAVVPEDQLSLAIGINGQNVRLAAKLTGRKIDIVGQKKAEEKVSEEKPVKKEKTEKKKSVKDKSDSDEKTAKKKSTGEEAEGEKEKKEEKKPKKKKDKKEDEEEKKPKKKKKIKAESEEEKGKKPDREKGKIKKIKKESKKE